MLGVLVSSAGGNAKLLQILLGQIYPSQRGVFFHVANDVGELKCQAQRSASGSAAGSLYPKMRMHTNPTTDATLIAVALQFLKTSVLDLQAADIGSVVSSSTSIAVPNASRSSNPSGM